MGKLLQTLTSDGLYLHGYCVPSKDKRIAILNIHGFEGNFYQNNFVHVLIDGLEKSQIGFLTVNTRGNGTDTEINTAKGKYRRIGGRYELLEEAYLDIDAWVKFLVDEGYQEIVLQGHSLGTMKVVRYLFEGKLKDKVNKLILLAPFDKKGELVGKGENLNYLINQAEEMIRKGKGEKLVSRRKFGDINISYKTWVSWYKQDDLGRIFEFCSPDYDFPTLKQIKIPTKIIVGSKDEFFHLSNPGHPEEAMDILLKHISNSQGKIIDGAVHSYKPHEDVMVKEVIKFVRFL